MCIYLWLLSYVKVHKDLECLLVKRDYLVLATLNDYLVAKWMALISIFRHLEDNLDDWLTEELDNFLDDDYLVFDCPGIPTCLIVCLFVYLLYLSWFWICFMENYLWVVTCFYKLTIYGYVSWPWKMHKHKSSEYLKILF